MKKLKVLIVVVFVMAMGMGLGISPIMAGGGKEKAPQTQAPQVPSWFGQIPPEDAIWGVGQAKLTNMDLAMRTAESRAQRSAAAQIGTLVQELLTDYANESGIIGNTRSLVAIENIGRSLVNMSLSGATINAREIMPDGTVFVRVTVRKATAMRQISSIVNNEVADFAEFRAAQALQKLDFELSRAQTNPSQFLIDED